MSSDLKDKMVECKNTSTSVLYLEFSLQKKSRDCIFCFFEGEDRKYYLSRISNKYPKLENEKIILFNANGKKNVFEIKKIIDEKDSHRNLKLLFFIDRDFDENNNIPTNMYITPCYSIENLYVNTDSFKKIIQKEFNVNFTTDISFELVEMFEKRFEEFCNEILKYNVLLKKSVENGNKIKTSSKEYKTSKLVNVSIDDVSCTSEYDSVINVLLDEHNISRKEMNEMIKNFKKCNNWHMNLRGKNQLDFFVKFITSLQQAVKSGKFLEKSDTINITITKNRISELSEYAKTPQCLERFLEENIGSM